MQDVYSDRKVDTVAIAACLNALAKWRRDALHELKTRIAFLEADSVSDGDEAMAASDLDAAASAERAIQLLDSTETGDDSGPQDDVPADQQWD